jgi:uncharacterized protein
VTGAALASLFIVGFVGGVHCIGMCGGIVTALTVRMPGERPKPLLHVAYHAGRLTTYAALGAATGALGATVAAVAPVQSVLYALAQVMLVALGLYLLGITRYLRGFERLGARWWRRVQPVAGRLLPVRTPASGYVAGLLWGMLPCGLVYAILATAMMSGSALDGAASMLAFGLGTLPALFAFGSVVQRFRRSTWVRRTAGAAVIAFGLVGISHAATITADSLWALLCT